MRVGKRGCMFKLIGLVLLASQEADCQAIISFLGGGGSGWGPSPSKAKLKNAQQSTQSHKWTAAVAIDGKVNTHFGSGSCIHTQSGPHQWWSAEFEERYTVTKVVVLNRDDCCEGRLNDVKITIGHEVCVQDTSGVVGGRNEFICQGGAASGLSIKLERSRGGAPLNFCEVQAWGYPYVPTSSTQTNFNLPLTFFTSMGRRRLAAEAAKALDAICEQAVADVQRDQPDLVASCLVEPAVCTPPDTMQIGGIDCVDDHIDGSKCINNNTGYLTLAEAWEKCGELSDCAFIMRYSDNKHYLRRRDDDFSEKGEDDRYHHVEYRCEAPEAPKVLPWLPPVGCTCVATTTAGKTADDPEIDWPAECSTAHGGKTHICYVEAGCPGSSLSRKSTYRYAKCTQREPPAPTPNPTPEPTKSMDAPTESEESSEICYEVEGECCDDDKIEWEGWMTDEPTPVQCCYERIENFDGSCSAAGGRSGRRRLGMFMERLYSRFIGTAVLSVQPAAMSMYGRRLQDGEEYCSMLKQNSEKPCIYGETWGCDIQTHTLWATEGCRGFFAVHYNPDIKIKCGEGISPDSRYECDLPAPGALSEATKEEIKGAMTAGVDRVGERLGLPLQAEEIVVDEAQVCGFAGFKIKMRKRDRTQWFKEVEDACACATMCYGEDAWMYNIKRGNCYCRGRPAQEKINRTRRNQNYVSSYAAA